MFWFVTYIIAQIFFVNALDPISLRNNSCSSFENDLIYESDGEAVLSLLLQEDVCSSDLMENEVAATAAYLLQKLNENEYVKGVKIGLRIYRSCGDEENWPTRAVLHAMLAQSDKCETLYHLGILLADGTPPIAAVSRSLHVATWRLLDEGPSAIGAAARILGEGPWLTRGEINVISNRTEETMQFAKSAADEGLCLLKPMQRTIFNNGDVDLAEMNVIFGNEDFIANTILNAQDNVPAFIIPSEDNITYHKDLSNGTIILLRNRGISEMHDIRRVYQIGNTILHIADMLNQFIIEYCENETDICDKLPPFINAQLSGKSTKRSLQEILDVLNIDDNTLNYYHDIFVKTNDTESEDGLMNIGNFNIITDVLTFNFNEETDEKLKKYIHAKCLQDHRDVKYCEVTALRCTNYYKGNHHLYHNYLNLYLRKDPWVPASLAVSGIGVITTVAILLFVIIRLCKGDVMEGNPLATIILLISLLPMFGSIIPFSVTFEDHENYQTAIASKSRYENFDDDVILLNQNVLCAWRVFILGISYCLLFSQLLSRAIMLCSVGSEGGFLSHVNGFLQITICFFMFLVQLCMSSQLLVYQLHEAKYSTMCKNIFDTEYFWTAVAYNVFLLFSLVVITPFVYRSQRNYMEGMLMTVASYIILIVWFVWILISIFFSANSTCKEAAMPLGLVSTAWIILGGILVPRSYLIVRGIARSDLVQALPSLTSISFAPRSNHYISRQTIYDCVNPAMLTRSGFPASELPTLPMRPPRRLQHDMIAGGATYDSSQMTPPLMNGRSSDDAGKITRF